MWEQVIELGVPPQQYFEAALALVFIEHYQTAPALRPAEKQREPNEPVRGTELRMEAETCTSRERVDHFLAEDGSYHGRHPEDIYITAPALAEILGVSTETARRRLRFFEEQEVVRVAAEGNRLFYELRDEFRPDTDELVPSEDEVIIAAKRLMNAVQED